MEKCYVVLYQDYTGEDAIGVFKSYESAHATVVDGVNRRTDTLEDEGYTCEVFGSGTAYGVSVPNTSMYYDWHIVEREIEP